MELCELEMEGSAVNCHLEQSGYPCRGNLRRQAGQPWIAWWSTSTSERGQNSLIKNKLFISQVLLGNFR